MIPLHDDVPAWRRPVVTYALIILNVLAFLYELGIGANITPFLQHWAVIPRELTLEWPHLLQGQLRPAIWLSVLTAMFLHGGWLHLGGNMLFLWIFGDNVEDRLGRVGFLLFYLASGVAATALQVYLNPMSRVPTLGASGAIAGVLGAYMVLYPRAQVLTLLPLGLLSTTFRVPALFYLLLWFGLQAVQGVVSLETGRADTGGVAWWAHVGGFILGILVGALLRLGHRPPPRNPYADRWYSNR
ncbi:rhomboid family intramembrane serine protease [bacterium]|nr:rhomboid family intramembrane serine protease [bacterium]